jgi:signal transduction histidine kinase
LSLSYGIIQNHNGKIELDSVVGQGSTFRITLPIQHTPTTTDAAGGGQ